MKENILGERLKELRVQRGIKQKVFAAALNMSSSAVSKWENGQNEPDMETLLKIAEYYGISMEELLKGGLAAPENTEQDLSGADTAQADTEGKTQIPKIHILKAILGIAAGFVFTVLLVTAGIVLWRAGKKEDNISYEIIAGRYTLDKKEEIGYGYNIMYEVSVFCPKAISGGIQEEVAAGVLTEWINGRLGDENIELIRVIYNHDKEAALTYDTSYPAVIFYLTPKEMEYMLTR